MQLKVKTLKAKVEFNLDVELTIKVSDLKEKVAEASNNEFPVDRQKLIFQGKILKDEDTLDAYGLKENDFLVCMSVAKKRTSTTPAPAPSADTATATTATATAGPAPVSAPAPAPAPTTTTPAPTTTTTTTTTPAVPAPATPLAPAPITDEQVQMVVDMGFPEDQVRPALTAARGNLDLCIEFLTNGIPPNWEQQLAQQQAQQQQQQQQQQAIPVASGSPLDALRSIPQFTEIQRIVQENPGRLQEVLQMIERSNPQLLRLVHENQAEFIRMMNEPIAQTPAVTAPTTAPTGTPGMPQMGMPGMGGMDMQQIGQLLQQMPPEQRNQLLGMASGMPPDQVAQFADQITSAMATGQMPNMPGGMPGQGGQMPQMPQVGPQLSAEEEAAVTRLCGLGFQRMEVIQVYIACDKNEELTANMLFDGMGGGFGGGGGDDDDQNMYG